MADFEDDVDIADQDMQNLQDDNEQTEEMKQSNEENDEQNQNNNKKGRGHQPQQGDIAHATKSGNFDSLNISFDDEASNKNVQKSVEGYVLFVTGVHEEAKDDDIYEKFSEFGHVKQFDVPLDRKTGFVKGYALIEFATFKEAQSAINGVDQSELYGKVLSVDWAFYKPQ